MLSKISQHGFQITERIFLFRALLYKCNFCCVALLYILIKIELQIRYLRIIKTYGFQLIAPRFDIVQECDATADATAFAAGNIIFIRFFTAIPLHFRTFAALLVAFYK